ncbi:MAG: trigger factor [Candidatus Omnitrophota bacterium]|jgi:FKBP-type peptidyl-prolyl cis-trans isomerase (trigger factor)|nr:trigger factor [Candidatus Omnitrophota bacterium]MDD5518215.1 trigger factor [Candidatus Omnitrophota bacterium]
MKTEVKKVDSNIRELNVEISGEVVKNKFEDVFKRISGEAKIPGFRPGHAPRDILEKNYAGTAHEQVLRELVPDIYNEAVNKEGLDVIELPEISEVKLDRSSLSFKAKVEVSPEIDVKDYKGIKIDYKSVSVAGDEVKRAIDSLKESRKLDKVDEALAKSLGYPSLSELEKVLDKQIFIQKENAERQKIESQIIEDLIKKVDFKLPQGLVKRQLEDMLRQAKVDLALKGVAREKIEEQDEKMRKELDPEAQKQVRIYLILSAIAKKENVALDDHMPRRVMEFLFREADWKVENA